MQQRSISAFRELYLEASSGSTTITDTATSAASQVYGNKVVVSGMVRNSSNFRTPDIPPHFLVFSLIVPSTRVADSVRIFRRTWRRCSYLLHEHHSRSLFSPRRLATEAIAEVDAHQRQSLVRRSRQYASGLWCMEPGSLCRRAG